MKNNNRNTRLPALRDPSPSVLGKVPPQSVDLEEAVLGAIMLEKDALIRIGGIISEKIFYKDQHQAIYGAIQSLNLKGDPIDLLTVTTELRKLGLLEVAGGAFYVTELTSKVASAANIEYHCRILQQQYIKRRSINIGSEIIQAGYDDMSDPFEIMETMQNHLLEILHDIDNGKTKTLKSVLLARIEEIGKLIGQAKGLTGVDTGFKAVNALTGGWQKPNLIILAARPAMGKTALALNFLTACAKSGKPCAIFSLEMSESELTDRILSQETRIGSAQDFQRGKISPHEYSELTARSGKISAYPIFIDDTAGLSISQLRSKAFKLKAQNGIEMILVDYLQLMSGEGSGNREQEISQIARGLKKIAKELDLPVIALSQLSRAVETRAGDKRPQLSDLRESGAIEQDADIVIFLHRPEYYGITEDSSGQSTAGTAEIIFAKHRNGALDTVLTKFIGRFTDFKDLEEEVPQYETTPSDHNYGSIFTQRTTEF